ncbi:MAG: hypothetical protein M3416_02535 [Acidobacteriota bacterium]|nr:hypothetical protein [Acidobacteriota bacterium]
MESSSIACLHIAYEQHSSSGRLVLREYISEEESEDFDELCLEVKNEFLAGAHTAYAKAVVKGLGKEMPGQQQQADALGLKDRTSISKMNNSGTIDGIRLTAALYLYPHLIDQRTRDQAALYGYARATSFIKAWAYKDATIERSMSPQDFSYLIGVLASSEWDSALCDNNAAAARDVAARIVRERALTLAQALEGERRRGEQNVLMLQGLCERWADFAVAALWMIPEYIPTDNIQ